MQRSFPQLDLEDNIVHFFGLSFSLHPFSSFCEVCVWRKGVYLIGDTMLRAGVVFVWGAVKGSWR